MIIELRRVNFVNKGAELMMHAMIQALSKKYPTAKFVMRHNVGSVDQRNNLNIERLMYWNLSSLPFSNYLRTIPNFMIGMTPGVLREKNRIYIDKDVDIVIDAAGFAYGDQWPSYQAKDAADYYERLKKMGKLVILMPQALGIFERSDMRQACRRIFQASDIIFARDSDSFAHASELVDGSVQIFQAPDFTNIVEGRVDANQQAFVGRPIIIPNYRMIDKTSSRVANQYPHFLTQIVNTTLESGHQPLLLIHEADRDEELANAVVRQCGGDVEVVKETDPLIIKGIVKNALFIVGSRFHGLVSGLSSTVPSIGTGWSHKYKKLFEDYGCSEMLVDPSNDFSEIKSKLLRLINADQNVEIRNALLPYAQYQKQLTNQMWERVFALIDSKHIL